MKICVAQTRPFTGDVQTNIEQHHRLIGEAASLGADMIIFPELSLTGYEPTLAVGLATSPDDHRFDTLQQLSTTAGVVIGVGMPTINVAGICISMILFQPGNTRQIYSKKYLHADEEPFFVSGDNLSGLILHKTNAALAICYELSVPEHAEQAWKNGSSVYIASVAKTARGMDQASNRLSNVANTYSMTVLLSNCVGLCDGDLCAGRSAAWDNTGKLIGQLNDRDEGILIVDTGTHQVLTRKF